jgi:hypothetical protein
VGRGGDGAERGGGAQAAQAGAREGGRAWAREWAKEDKKVDWQKFMPPRGFPGLAS